MTREEHLKAKEVCYRQTVEAIQRQLNMDREALRQAYQELAEIRREIRGSRGTTTKEERL